MVYTGKKKSSILALACFNNAVSLAFKKKGKNVIKSPRSIAIFQNGTWKKHGTSSTEGSVIFFFCTPFYRNYRDLERKWVKYLGQAGIHEAMKGHAVYTKKSCIFSAFFEVRSPKLGYYRLGGCKYCDVLAV